MLILLIFISCFVVALNLPTFFYKELKTIKDFFALTRLKPFDCECCISFWLTLGFMIFQVNFFIALLLAFGSFFLQCEYFKYKMNS